MRRLCTPPPGFPGCGKGDAPPPSCRTGDFSGTIVGRMDRIYGAHRSSRETARVDPPPPAASQVLSVTDLRRAFHDRVAVDGITFDVGRNEIVGLLGPNGAGKTTTINMILGVLEPTAGTIRIEGVDARRFRSRALERTNFAAVYAPLPGNLTVRQNLRVFGLLYGVADLAARVEALVAEF